MATNSFPTRFEMRNDLASRVDVHLIRLEANGSARLELPDGTWWEYPSEALEARDTIGERAASARANDRCCRLARCSVVARSSASAAASAASYH